MTQRRLVISLLVFFLALALPSSLLVYQAYGQLKWEAFYQHQRLARELTLRIDSGFRDLIEREEKRPISDYEFLNVAGSDKTPFLQRSPLSAFPPQTDIPGLVGYFQVDPSGQLRTPLVPASNASDYGISAAELRQREQLEGRIREVLDQNRLVGKSDNRLAPTLEEAVPEEKPAAAAAATVDLGDRITGTERIAGQADRMGQTVFDELSWGKTLGEAAAISPVEQLEDLNLEDSYDVASGVIATAPELEQKMVAKRSRKEKVNLPRPRDEDAMVRAEQPARDAEALASPERQQAIRIQTFESEVEALEFALLDSGHFVLFRRTWRDGERQVQGLLIDPDKFFDRMIAPAFRESSLASISRLIVAWRGDILQRYEPVDSREYGPGGGRTSDELLYQGRLVAPFGDVELIYTLARIPIGAGGRIIVWSALVLALVLVGGCFMLLRLGQRQLALARQQQDFVSAVSHELKTPLTSIRMYGEILREGWADESKRKSYYDYIFHEAERLTRLINNVLQLARMSRNEQVVNLETLTVADALCELRPRLESLLEAGEIEWVIDGEPAADAVRIEIDLDWFLQIFINLVDNAVKFSAGAETRRVDIHYQQLRDGRVQFAVRDYGPGISPDQMKKIFTLFYRSESELTRETVGTGIGLALVQQLADGMHAEVDVVNCDPGAEFRIRFPAA